jgi:hypothetical protein
MGTHATLGLVTNRYCEARPRLHFVAKVDKRRRACFLRYQSS